MTGIACAMRASAAAQDWRRLTLGLIAEDISGNDILVGYRRFAFTNVGVPLPDVGTLNYAFLKTLDIQFIGSNSSTNQFGFNILTHVPQNFFAAVEIQLATGRWVSFSTATAFWQNTALIFSGQQATVWSWFNQNPADLWDGTDTDPVGSIRAIKLLG